jgi:hypothetical protein
MIRFMGGVSTIMLRRRILTIGACLARSIFGSFRLIRFFQKLMMSERDRYRMAMTSVAVPGTAAS